ncbi:MAG: HAD family phosphatase [Parachlamydiales bacterium]|jgi:HAD superfamily hydrolase (TIGR01509 family)
MKWIKDFNLFLFDLDGLLVNTEVIHFQAYVNMLRRRGYNLDWTFLRFCEVAHFDDDSLKEGVYSKFPNLYEEEPNWNVLKKEKNDNYLDLLKSSKVDLMKGVEALLNCLKKENKKLCVVTNSSKPMTDMIIAKQHLLKTIPHWITREDYLLPKPNPDGYLHAISLHGEAGDRIIGFEDSLRGLSALHQTPAQCVLIGNITDPKSKAMIPSDAFHFETFDDIPDKLL